MAIEDDEIVFNSIFSLIEKLDDKKDQNEVTLFDIKDYIDSFPVEKLRKLSFYLLTMLMNGPVKT